MPTGQGAWTESEDRELRRLVADGMPAARAALELGRSAQSVYKRMERMGMAKPRSKVTPGELDRLRECEGRGMTVAETVRELGLSRGRVHTAAKWWGLCFRQHGETDPHWRRRREAALGELEAAGADPVPDPAPDHVGARPRPRCGGFAWVTADEERARQLDAWRDVGVDVPRQMSLRPEAVAERVRRERELQARDTDRWTQAEEWVLLNQPSFEMAAGVLGRHGHSKRACWERRRELRARQPPEHEDDAAQERKRRSRAAEMEREERRDAGRGGGGKFLFGGKGNYILPCEVERQLVRDAEQRSRRMEEQDEMG